MGDKVRHTSASHPICDNTARKKQQRRHEVLTSLEKRKLGIGNVKVLVDYQPPVIQTISIRKTFFSVLFMAPVTPELQCDAKLIHEMRNTASNLASSGGGFLLSTESSSCLSSLGIAGSSVTSRSVFGTGSSDGMVGIELVSVC